MDKVLFNALISYFNAIGIRISQNELRLQLFSHPHTPSLYAVSETLHFLKIENVAAQVNPEQLELLPDNFIAFLRDTKNTEYFAHVRKKANRIFLADRQEAMTKEDFHKQWDGIVLLAEQENDHTFPTVFGSNSVYLLLITVSLLFVWPNIPAILFCLIGILGLFLSEEIFKTSNNMSSALGAKICGKAEESGCTAILGSSKYKVGVFSLNDLLFSFFLSTLVLTLLYPVFGHVHLLLYSMAILAVMATVFIQRFIARNWCKLCLLSSLCIALQAVFVFAVPNFWNILPISDSLWITLKKGAIFTLLFFIALFIIFNIRKLKTQRFELSVREIDLLRFKRSSKIVALVLSNSKHIKVAEEIPVLESENDKAEHSIRLVLSTSCRFCKNAFAGFYTYYQKNKTQYRFQIIFNHYEVRNSASNKVAANLIQVYQGEGFEAMLRQLDKWFSHPGNTNLPTYSGGVEDENFAVLFEQRAWCKTNALFHTPILVIDTHIIPEFYDTYFLDDFLNIIVNNTMNSTKE